MIDSTERFSSRVEAYIRSRPGYPVAVCDVLRTEIGFSADWTVADVGSGTGLSTQLFLDHGNEVFAIEPNASMRHAAEAMLGDNRQFHSLDATAEQTTLASGSVDLVVAGQAFHWFDRERSRKEFSRILRPGGYVVLMWNARRLSGTAFLADYEQMLLAHGTDYRAVRHENVHGQSMEGFFARDYGHAALSNPQQHDLEGLVARVESSSYVPGPGQPGHEELMASVRDLFARHETGGRVTIEYDTLLYWGRVLGE